MAHKHAESGFQVKQFRDKDYRLKPAANTQTEKKIIKIERQERNLTYYAFKTYIQ